MTRRALCGVIFGWAIPSRKAIPRSAAEIAQLYRGIAAAETLVAAPEELIFIAMNTLLTPGDHVIATFPGYQSLYQVAEAIGCTVSRWPLRPVGDGWQLDLADLRAAITPRTRLLVVNFPHNPTGHLPAQAEFAAIVEIARQHGLYLFADEMYRLLEYDSTDRLSAACDLYERALSLSGLSKAFALPGLRIGWLATHDHAALGRCLAFHDYTTICNSAASEILGLMALRAREAILARNRSIIRDNLGLAAEFFGRHADRFRWLPPQAGSVAFPQLTAETSVADFCRATVERQGLMILPGDVFDYAGNHFRLGLGRASFGAALGQLEEYLRVS